jgi:hypothetical protein
MCIRSSLPAVCLNRSSLIHVATCFAAGHDLQRLRRKNLGLGVGASWGVWGSGCAWSPSRSRLEIVCETCGNTPSFQEVRVGRVFLLRHEPERDTINWLTGVGEDCCATAARGAGLTSAALKPVEAGL